MTVIRSGQGHCRKHNKINRYDGYQLSFKFGSGTEVDIIEQCI